MKHFKYLIFLIPLLLISCKEFDQRDKTEVVFINPIETKDTLATIEDYLVIAKHDGYTYSRIKKELKKGRRREQGAIPRKNLPRKYLRLAEKAEAVIERALDNSKIIPPEMARNIRTRLIKQALFAKVLHM